MAKPWLTLSAAEDETLDGVGGSISVLQKRKGQRLASDDVLLAAMSVKFAPKAHWMLDLGTGKGSVALMALASQPRLRAIGVEAYPESFRLAVRNAYLNQLNHRFTPVFSDIRAFVGLRWSHSFDVITGAPPFIKVGHGVLPANEQRRYGRFELRGGIEDYCECAASLLSKESGKCIMLMDAKNTSRTRNAFSESGLFVERIIDVHPRPNLPPIYQIFIGSYTKVPLQTYPISMRGLNSERWSEEYQTLRTCLGLDN
ncbi:MAG: tRNA1(Val) (adenine(37)-N6)-methyltransferase [Bradymonadia bacterium]